mgnify:CR=1 FL=1
MTDGKSSTESREIDWPKIHTFLPAPTTEELLAAFNEAANKLPGFTPKRWKGYYGHEADNRCGCAVVAMYLAAGEPLGRSDYMDEEDLIRVWVSATYGAPVYQGITCGFDNVPQHEGCDAQAFAAGRAAAQQLFPPADMAHATAL